MVPVVQEEHAQVFIVIGRSRAIDDDTTKNTLPCLKRKVRVVPGTSILSCSPSVCDSVPGSSRALRYRDNTILIIGVILSNTVPMNASAVSRIDQVVCHMDSNGVAPICEQRWAGNRAGVILDKHANRDDKIYPLTAIAERETPSGATVASSRVSQYSLVAPVLGTSATRCEYSKGSGLEPYNLPVV